MLAGRVFNQRRSRTGNRWPPSTRRFGPPSPRWSPCPVAGRSTGRPGPDFAGASGCRDVAAGRSRSPARSPAIASNNPALRTRRRAANGPPPASATPAGRGSRRWKIVSIGRGRLGGGGVGQAEADDGEIELEQPVGRLQPARRLKLGFRLRQAMQAQIQFRGNNVKVRHAGGGRGQIVEHLAGERIGRALIPQSGGGQQKFVGDGGG